MAQKVAKKALGSQGLVASVQGLGTMTMTAFYGSFNRRAAEETSIQTIGAALDAGINFLDTAWIYQSFGADGEANTTNEELVGKALARYGRQNFVVATKTGLLPSFAVTGKPEAIRRQLAESLQRLNTDYIDLYYLHRIASDTPLEETVACLKEFVAQGKVRYIGLSECTASELRRAHKVHPITAVQMEYSLQTREIEKDLIPTCRELGVGIVAYSPLGRGMLSATFANAPVVTDPKDFRSQNPRFKGEALAKNMPTKLFDLAKAKGVTPAQLALAWLHHQGDDIFPIPGTKSKERVAENAGGALLKLTKEELAEIAASVPKMEGKRYGDTSSNYESRL